MNKGTILIVTTWILAILTLLAIGIGFRVGLEIKLTGNSLDRLKARYVAKAGIKKAITEKWIEYYEGLSLGVDAFSESWANNEDLFKDQELGEGSFSVSYKPGELDRARKEIVLYGLQDETSRININTDKALDVLRSLLLNNDIELEEAESIVSAIKNWREEGELTVQAGVLDTATQSDQAVSEKPGRPFVSKEELLQVAGITRATYDAIFKENVTLHGDGRININTANEEVLKAVFGIGYPELAEKVADYRRGVDGEIGTDDDRWFTMGQAVIDRKEKGMVEVKDLNEQSWHGNIFGISENEYNRIKELIGTKGLLSTSSDYYRANCEGRVGKIRKAVDCVFLFKKPSEVRETGFADEIPPPDFTYLYWHETR